MDYGEAPSTTEDAVLKPRSRLGMALIGCVVLTLGFYALSNGDASGGDDAAIDVPVPTTSPPSPTTVGPISTDLTQTNGADTIRTPVPDRGAFRNALINRLTSSCEGLVDGPEPVPAGLYNQHAECVAEALVNLDERCRLAATVFYVQPGDEALDIACDIDPEATQDFRESVRQSMVLSCDNRLSDEESLEPYYEYERCLQSVEVDLDQICYLAARAQYANPVDEELRRDCAINEDVALASTVE